MFPGLPKNCDPADGVWQWYGRLESTGVGPAGGDSKSPVMVEPMGFEPTTSVPSQTGTKTEASGAFQARFLSPLFDYH
jgi:hypothetical protein